MDRITKTVTTTNVDNINAEKKEKSVYIEIMRIVAVFFVIFHHSSGYMLFTYQPIGSLRFLIYLFISVFCTFSVPLFFAISGALMLEKDYEPRKILQRVIKMFVILFVFSFAYYMKHVYRGDNTFSIEDFLTLFYTRGTWGHLWFMYVYIAYLMSFPFLRALVKNLDTKYYYYLIGLALFYSGIIPTIEYLLWKSEISLYSCTKASWVTSLIVLYPCLGYLLKNKFEITQKRLIILWIFNILGIAISCYLTYRKGITEGQLSHAEESFHSRFGLLNCICIFSTIKYMFRSVSAQDLFGKVCISVGSCVFGIYLFHLMIYKGNLQEILKQIGFEPMLSAFIMSLYLMTLSYIVTFVVRLKIKI